MNEMFAEHNAIDRKLRALKTPQQLILFIGN